MQKVLGIGGLFFRAINPSDGSPVCMIRRGTQLSYGNRRGHEESDTLRPNLALSHLQGVQRQEMAQKALMIQRTRTPDDVPMYPLPGLRIVLLPEDAMRFAALTERSVGKRLVVMLGEKHSLHQN